MAKNGYKVFDSDLHIMEPVDLWQRYMDSRYRDQAPMGLNRHATDLQMVHPDGRPWGISSEFVATAPPVGITQSAAKDSERYGPYAARGWSAEAQIDAMDAEGVDVAVIYPTRGLHAVDEPDMDPGLAAAVARAYNDWLYDFCQVDPNRLLGSGMISAYDVDDAVAEARRAVQELGFRGVFLRPNIVNGRNWHDLYYEPLWATLEELNVPLGFHEGIGTRLPEVGSIFGSNFMLRHTFCHSGEQMLATASFCGGGTFERHPNLRVAFLEGNCSWLPFLLYRLDEHWEWRGETDAPELTMAPSEYFKRQGYASAEADEEPVKYVVDDLGSSNILFSTDFPHSDSKFPKSVERFLELDISEEAKRKILWDNCIDLYHLE